VLSVAASFAKVLGMFPRYFYWLPRLFVTSRRLRICKFFLRFFVNHVFEDFVCSTFLEFFEVSFVDFGELGLWRIF